MDHLRPKVFLWPAVDDGSAGPAATAVPPQLLPDGGRCLDHGAVYHAFIDPGSPLATASVGRPVPLVIANREESQLDHFMAAQKMGPDGFLVCRVDGCGKPATLGLIRNAREYPLDLQATPAEKDVFSRHRGLLEIGDLANSKVLVIGLGSLGGQATNLLARSGVGKFTLVDFDTISPENLSRHIAGVRDLGRKKVAVVAESIRQVNPWTQVEELDADILQIDLEGLLEIEKPDVVLVGTDNNATRYALSRACKATGVPLVIGRVLQRGIGCDVFWQWPGHQEACFGCVSSGAFSQDNEEISSRQSSERNIPAYSDREQTIWAGLAVDIAPCVAMMARLALIILTNGKESSFPGWAQDFGDNHGLFFYASRRESIYQNFVPLAEAGARPELATYKWYSVETHPNEKNCRICMEVAYANNHSI